MSQSSGNSGDVVDTVVIGDLLAAHHAHHAIDCILGNSPPPPEVLLAEGKSIPLSLIRDSMIRHSVLRYLTMPECHRKLS